MRSRRRRRGRNLHSVHPADITLADHVPASLAGDQDDNSLQYVGQVHNFPSRSPRSGLVRRAGGEGALLAFGAFEESDPVFRPTPLTPDFQTI